MDSGLEERLKRMLEEYCRARAGFQLHVMDS